jgi:hypothetical protein
MISLTQLESAVFSVYIHIRCQTLVTCGRPFLETATTMPVSDLAQKAQKASCDLSLIDPKMTKLSSQHNEREPGPADGLRCSG